ncbi:MAG: hypothetical protein K2P04_01170, partial [Oscillospiraceae bacterium]|nr:hypothetical protein [Oscillospiraceae bacterium]
LIVPLLGGINILSSPVDFREVLLGGSVVIDLAQLYIAVRRRRIFRFDHVGERSIRTLLATYRAMKTASWSFTKFSTL